MSSPVPVVAITNSLYKSKKSIFCASVLLRPLSDRFNNQYKLYRIESGINNMPTTVQRHFIAPIVFVLLVVVYKLHPVSSVSHSAALQSFNNRLLLTTYLLTTFMDSKENQ